jgi:hypothetical protein
MAEMHRTLRLLRARDDARGQAGRPRPHRGDDHLRARGAGAHDRRQRQPRPLGCERLSERNSLRLAGEPPAASTTFGLPANDVLPAARVVVDGHHERPRGLGARWAKSAPICQRRCHAKLAPTQASRSQATKKPRHAGLSRHAPKRTRTSTRLSRTRPSTWRGGCQMRPDRAGASRSFGRGDKMDGLNDLDVAAAVATTQRAWPWPAASGAFRSPARWPGDGGYGRDAARFRRRVRRSGRR